MAETKTPRLSFIGIVDFSRDALWRYASQSVADILGYEPEELVGKRSIDLVHPDEANSVVALHRHTIEGDKAAALAYMRMKHKDPFKGYILCGVTRTIVHNVVVGSVSYAYPGGKALHNASTAREVTVISPTAKDLQYTRWDAPASDPIPLDPEDLTYERPPSQSFRTALFLERFSIQCPIQYCNNDILVDACDAIGNSFWNYVAEKDIERVRGFIDTVKGWGVNDDGEPSDGGFGYGAFSLLTTPRASTPDELGGKKRPRNGRNRSRNQSCPISPRPARTASGPNVKFARESKENVREVDAIFSAHSDGIVVILRPKSVKPL